MKQWSNANSHVNTASAPLPKKATRIEKSSYDWSTRGEVQALSIDLGQKAQRVIAITLEGKVCCADVGKTKRGGGRKR